MRLYEVIWGYVTPPFSHNPFITFLTLMMVISCYKTTLEISRIIPFVNTAYCQQQTANYYALLHRKSGTYVSCLR